MSEHSLIDETPEPRTRESLGADLRALGVTPGMTLIVHSSLSSLGWVCGGPVAVVQALMDVVTPEGTLVRAHAVWRSFRSCQLVASTCAICMAANAL